MKKFRPFWSYRIEETEAWLEEMARKGYQLKSLQPLFRMFTFELGQAENKRYLIELKSNEQLYEAGGWQQVTQAGSWTVYEGTAPNRFSSRENIFHRLRKHYLWGSIILGLLFFYLNTLAGFWLAFQVEDFQIAVYFGVFFVLFSIFLCGNIWLNNKYYEKERSYLNITEQIAANAIRKRRFGWMYVPYTTKRWLERIFAQGYELEYVKGISFYLKPRESTNVSYEIVNERPKNVGIMQFYKDFGWEAKCLNNTLIWHISIWAKPYEVGEAKPLITSARDERLKSLRRGFRNTSLMTMFFIAVVGMNIFNMLNQIGSDYISDSVTISLLVLSIIVLIIWIWLYAQSVYGYRQEKKEIHEMIV